MKKLISCTLILSVLVFLLSGCSLLESIVKLDAPEISVVGNVLKWDAVEKASDYEVYKNDKYITNTKGDLYYVAAEVKETAQFYVKAVDDSKKSDSSNKVVIYQNSDFKEEDIMRISLHSGNIYTVPSNIKCLEVKGSANETSIVIADRITDITIILDNVTLTSPQGKSCITTSDGTFGSKNINFTATLIVNGENTLTGSDYTASQSQPSENSGKKGTQGGEGGSGIIIKGIAINGSGTLVLYGGTGGNGGTGADSGGFSSSVYGNGGDGGAGGDGIKCATAVLAMKISGILKAYGGEGGKKGKPGSNGSILTGPFNTAQWDSRFGEDGKNGAGISGTLMQLSGTYVD